MRRSMVLSIVGAVPVGVGLAAGWAYYGPGSHDGCSHKMEVSNTLAASETVCPVTGEGIPSPEHASGKSVYKGKTHYFCCPTCKPEFDKEPERYLHPQHGNHPKAG